MIVLYAKEWQCAFKRNTKNMMWEKRIRGECVWDGRVVISRIEVFPVSFWRIEACTTVVLNPRMHGF